METLFSKVLEKTIYDKARDKMKQGKKQDEEETQNEKEKDYLAAILKKLGFSGKDLNEEAAIMVKNEALRNLKERLLTRAEIIQRRLEEEQKNLEQAYVTTFYGIYDIGEPEAEGGELVAGGREELRTRGAEGKLPHRDSHGARFNPLQAVAPQVRESPQETGRGPSARRHQQEGCLRALLTHSCSST